MAVTAPAGVSATGSDVAFPRARQLGRFVSELTLDAIPAAVRTQAQRIVADTVGCIVGGAGTAPVAPVLDVVGELAGAPRARVLGTALRTDCATAAFANSYLADALDFEDTMVSHPSAAVVPAALAVAEHVGASGADVVRAVVAAYEVGVRVQRAVMPTFARRQEVMTEYAWKAYPAVVATGALLGLDARGWVEAFGYAGACSPVPSRRPLRDRPLTWLKSNYGAQTHAGVMAGLLARRGFLARRPLLEGGGELHALLGSDQWRPEALSDGLGHEWLVLEANFKSFPCCRYIHPVLDALEAILEGQQLAADSVTEVRVYSFRALVDGFADYRPTGLIDAEFSAPYAVAMTLLRRPPGPAWHDPANLGDPAVTALADRVRFYEDPAFTRLHIEERRYGAAVEVRTGDGSVRTARSDRPRGGPDSPLSAEELETKFLRLTAPSLGAARAAAAHELLLHLEELPDVRQLTGLLVTPTQRELEEAR